MKILLLVTFMRGVILSIKITFAVNMMLKCTKLFGLGETALVSNFDNGIGPLWGDGRCLLRLSNDSFNWVVQLENSATFLGSKGLCFGTGRIK